MNSYLDNDKSTGELISPLFTIERKHINFLIGGGNHPGLAGLQLRVEDKAVRFATGRSLEETGQFGDSGLAVLGRLGVCGQTGDDQGRGQDVWWCGGTPAWITSSSRTRPCLLRFRGV